MGCASQQKKQAPVVRDLRIEGNQAISSRQIQKKILTAKTGWWPFATKQYFDPVSWEADLRRIVRLYENAYGRPPAAAESRRAAAYLDRFARALQAESDAGDADADARRLGAWQALCQVILASNEFVSIR